MEQAVGENGRGGEEEADCLVATVEKAQGFAALKGALLFVIRFQAVIDHGAGPLHTLGSISLWVV